MKAAFRPTPAKQAPVGQLFRLVAQVGIAGAQIFMRAFSEAYQKALHSEISTPPPQTAGVLHLCSVIRWVASSFALWCRSVLQTRRQDERRRERQLLHGAQVWLSTRP